VRIERFSPLRHHGAMAKTELSHLSTTELIALDRAHVWHPFTPMKPWCEEKDILVIERGEGEFLIDTEGRRYIDGISSLWCNVHGHHVAELNQAVIEQLNQVAHTTLLGLANIPATLLAKRLVDLAAACDLDLPKVFYSDNGSTAVEVACKMAFQYWKNLGKSRGKFLALGDSYHGDTLGAVSVGGIPLFHEAFRGLTFAVDFIDAPVISRSVPTLAGAIEALDRQLAAAPDAYAAIVVEPLVQGAGGMLMHTPGFLRELRRLADKYDVLLIADEVMTGFGRTGKMFACEQEGVTPDFLCLSKGLTAGYMPLGVTMTSRKIFDAFYADPVEGKTFYHGHTYTGHPLACAVALASLDLFEKNDVMTHVQALMPVLADALAQARQSSYVKNARQLGLIGAIDLAHVDGSVFPYHWRVGGAVCARMRELGIIVRPIADTLIIMPPLAIREENMRRLCDGVLHSLTWLPSIIDQLVRKPAEVRS
jgi:adenosylmethionine---8-amino-7-oxononanoate aminotransferase